MGVWCNKWACGCRRILRRLRRNRAAAHSHMDAKFASLVARLDAVTTRLETLGPAALDASAGAPRGGPSAKAVTSTMVLGAERLHSDSDEEAGVPLSRNELQLRTMRGIERREATPAARDSSHSRNSACAFSAASARFSAIDASSAAWPADGRSVLSCGATEWP